MERDSHIISYSTPAQEIREPGYTIPPIAVMADPPKFSSPPGSRQIDVSLVGAPNAGKSSLMN
jgi:ribosome biogenesis GTPase A